MFGGDTPAEQSLRRDHVKWRAVNKYGEDVAIHASGLRFSAGALHEMAM